MPVERHLLFSNGVAYNIHDTMNRCVVAWNEWEDGLIPAERINEIIHTLEDLVFMVDVDYDMFIPDPYNGILTPLDVWLRVHGVRDETFDLWEEMSIGTLDTMPLTDSEDDISVIGEEEEWEMIQAAHVMMQIGQNPVFEPLSDIEECIEQEPNEQ